MTARHLTRAVLFGCASNLAIASQVLSAEPAAETAPQVAAPAPEVRFDIFEYVVDGNSVLPAVEIEEAVYPFLGEQRSADDVDKAREELEKRYQARGYQTVQVRIPQQGVESGIIHFEVVENPVGRLRIVGSKFHSLAAIKEAAPSLAEGTVPNMARIQEDIVALNQEPDRRVTPRLSAGVAPGTVDVELQVEDKFPLHGNVEVNNQYSQKTTELRTSASLSYANLWQRGHSLSLAYQVAPQRFNDAQVFSASYLYRLRGRRPSILVYGVKSNSDVAVLAGTSVIGKGSIFGLRAIGTLPGTDTFFHNATAGVDFKDLSQNVVTGGVPSRAAVRYLPASLAYAATWQNGNVQTQAGVTFNFALPAGSGSEDFDRQRFNATRQYSYLRLDASHRRPLSENLTGILKLQGQISGDALISSEQFSAGGANTVRGYYEAERLGDSGVLWGLELQTRSFASSISPNLDEWYFSAFAEAASLWSNKPLPDETTHYSIASAGVGTRFSALQNTVNGAFDIAYALADGGATKAGDFRLHFRLSSGF